VANIQEMLTTMVERGASDLHIVAESPPLMRLDGVLTPVTPAPLTAKETKDLCYSVLTDMQKHRFEEDLELDFSFGIRDVSRFRGNLFLEKGFVGGAFRTIPIQMPTFEDLHLPPVVGELAKLPRGLVLVTGPTGCGKSSTLAAMIDRVNTERHERIITVEDPIEFVHKSRNCLVTQREVFADTKGFGDSLKHVLRQDPDIVLIGEMRDLETIEAALIVAETGHLVFSTLHTNSAVQTINRVIDVFPPHQQPQVRAQLSVVLQAVVSQLLLPRMDGKGRVPAVEVMIPNPAIRNLIREAKTHQIYSQMQVGQTKSGMQTMTQALLDLYERHQISYDEMIGNATEPEELQGMLSARPHGKGAQAAHPAHATGG
jgi:twitching motility protein PilT